MSPWQILGVAEDIGVADLRRRYATLIKTFRPETHPQEFARIREAYEVALPFARERESEAREAADTAADAAIDVAPATASADAGRPPEVAPAADVARVVASDAPAEDEHEEPELATHFRRFQAAVASAAGTRDEALLPDLRALLQARTRASLDDSQALEFALMRWFIEADAPSLTLLFEAGRAFDWHAHPARLSSWLSAWALQRMEILLAMSRDLVHARHFSGNAWLRRLHSPAAWPRLLANRPAVLEAAAWARRWQHLAEDADARQLANALDKRTLRGLAGWLLLSTDLLLGALCASATDSLSAGLLVAAVVTCLAIVLRQALFLLASTDRARPLGRFVAWWTAQWKLGALLVAGLAFSGLLMFCDQPDASALSRLGLAMAVPAALLSLRLAWLAVGWVEQVLALTASWRSAVDRLELERLASSPAGAREPGAFGPRLTLLERLKAIPAALRLERAEIARSARPSRPRLFGRLEPGKWSRGRWIWFALWIAFVIARGLIAVGDR